MRSVNVGTCAADCFLRHIQREDQLNHLFELPWELLIAQVSNATTDLEELQSKPAWRMEINGRRVTTHFASGHSSAWDF
eukprot:1350425-Amorphochlora_amoeboformis.AAC.1